MTRIFRWIRAAAVLGMALFSVPVPAQFPDGKPMRIIVPYAAGGVTDAVARALAARIAESLSRPVLVENRPGASTFIGMQACAKADPDGLTTCLTVPDSLSYNPALFTNVPYDAEKDFAPVINLGFANNLLVANAATPFATYKEMIAHAKANPDTLNWATWGTATIPDVYARWVMHKAGIKIVTIPYKGSAGTIPAVLSGEAQITFMGFGSALSHIKAGKLKALVTIGTRRSALMPNLPTLEEEGGDPGLVTYFAVFAPAATPRGALERLNAEFTKAIQTPQGQEFFKNYTLDFSPNTVAHFTAYAKSDRENAARVFQSIGVKPAAQP